MNRMRWQGLGAIVVPLVLAGLVRAEDSPLAQLPADSAIVLQIHGIDRTKDRLQAMLNTALPDLAPKLKAQIEEGLKFAMEGREFKGLAKEGPHFVVLTELPKQGESANKGAIVLRLTNYRDFLDGFLKEEERKTVKPDKAGYDVAMVGNEERYLIDRKNYLVFTPDKELADQLVKKGPGLDSKLNKDVAKKLLDADAAAYVNMEAVNKAYGNQLQQARQVGQLLIPMATAQMGKQMAEMIQAMYEGFFQFAEDSRLILLTAEFRPEGLALHLQTRVGPDTKTNDVFKAGKKAAFEQLATLPTGEISYTAFQLDPHTLKLVQTLMQGFMDEESQSLREALDQWVAAGPQSMLATYRFPPGGMQIWQSKDAAKATASMLKFFQALDKEGSFQNAVLKEKPEVKADAQSHRGFKLNSVSMIWDLEKTVEKNGGIQIPEELKKQMLESMKKMLGEGSKLWFGTDGKIYIQVAAKDWPAAKSLLDKYLDGKEVLGKEKAYQEARKQLPADATMLSLVDALPFTQSFADYILSILKAIPGNQLKLPSLPMVKGNPAYVGMVLTLAPELGSFDIWIPGSAIAEVRKLVEPMFRGAGN